LNFVKTPYIQPMNSTNPIDPAKFQQYMLAKDAFLKLYNSHAYEGGSVILSAEEVDALFREGVFNLEDSSGFLN